MPTWPPPCAAAWPTGRSRDGIDPDVTAVLIASTLQGLAYEWLLQPHAVDLDRAYAALGELLRDHLAPA